MAIFGRRGRRAQDERDADEGDEAALEAGAEDGGAQDTGTVVRGAPTRPQGPWDVEDLAEDDAGERLDLGAIQVPVPDGAELRLDLNEQGQPMAATLVHEQEVMQLMAFAAPRTEPVWPEVREEIADTMRASGDGASASDAEGPWGVELHARLPTDQPGVFVAARFIGIDGPRWFLRALVSGPRTSQGESDPVLLDALRDVVVVRGPDAMPPRDALPLRLPHEAQASVEAAQAGQVPEVGGAEVGGAEVDGEGEQRRLLPPPERGPEITETR